MNLVEKVEMDTYVSEMSRYSAETLDARWRWRLGDLEAYLGQNRGLINLGLGHFKQNV